MFERAPSEDVRREGNARIVTMNLDVGALPDRYSRLGKRRESSTPHQDLLLPAQMWAGILNVSHHVQICSV